MNFIDSKNVKKKQNRIEEIETVRVGIPSSDNKFFHSSQCGLNPRVAQVSFVYHMHVVKQVYIDANDETR